MSQGVRGTYSICSVADCDNRALARLLCGKHYRRWLLFGDPLLGKPRTVWAPKYVETDRGFTSLCWVVPTDERYRPRCKWLRDQLPDRPPWMVYMHLCERWAEPNRCVRPDHITVATRAENNAHNRELRIAAGVPYRKQDR